MQIRSLQREHTARIEGLMLHLLGRILGTEYFSAWCCRTAVPSSQQDNENHPLNVLHELLDASERKSFYVTAVTFGILTGAFPSRSGVLRERTILIILLNATESVSAAMKRLLWDFSDARPHNTFRSGF